MALQPCIECGAKMSSQAKVCPGCGAPSRKKTSNTTKLVGLFIAVVVAVAVLSPKVESPASSVNASKTPVDPAAKAKANARFAKTVAVLTLIKSAMREPDSLKWEEIVANEGGDVVCVQYRARNGFGGVNLEKAIYAKGKLQTTSAAWNANCAQKSLYEMKHAQRALD